MRNILCTTSGFGKTSPDAVLKIESNGYKLVLNPYGRKLKENELQKLLFEFKPIGMLAGTEQITRQTLDITKDYLKAISRVGVGWDNVDHAAVKEFGIKIFRTEGVLNQAVAELTIGMMLCALRNIALHDRSIRSGIWEKHMGVQLKGKTVGIIGFGAIGQRVGELVSAFGANIIYFDLYPKTGLNAESCTLEDLLAKSDIVTLHTDGSNTVLGAQELENCKKGVIIINTARGGLVDEDALYLALQSGQVSYACLDVFEKEPYSGRLTQLENMVLTSHIGSYAKEARKEMEEMAVSNLLNELEG
jgi:D-3-phosphoglycerate dehydrogenase / 2-oxoglutarate reductase